MSSQKPGFIMLFIMILSNISFAQNFNWITPNKTYLKMYVADDGLYRITKSDFTNAGINTSGIDPRTIKVYNKGAEIPIYFSGEQDGTFGDNDYFDFYGVRKYGGATNFYESNNQIAYITNEYYDLYSDTNFYWAGWDGANGLRYSASEYSVTTPFLQDYFYETVHFEKDKIYSLGENISASDYRFLNTERIRGESWYWALLSRNQSISDTLSTPSLSPTPQNATMRVFAYPQNYSTSILNEHRIQVIVNGNVVSTIFTNDFRRIDTTVNFSSSLLSATSVNNIELKYVPDSTFSGMMFMDLFELKYPKLFQLENHKLSAAINMTDTTSKLFRVSGFTSLNPVNIFDVVNNIRVTNFTSNGDTLKFTGKSNAGFEIVNDIITKKPFRIKQRQVPNLVSNANGTDYLVIYNSLFTSQAEQLRAYRETHDNYRSSKAEIEDIYDIFNFGQENPVAIRNFVKYIYDAWQLPKIKFICLMGRSSLDPKRNLSSSVYYQNFVPSYGNPNSDGYLANIKFGTFYYNNDIAIGRLPAYYPAEAQTMVDKIIAYENEPIGKWWKAFTYITGGGTLNEQLSHQQRSNFEIEQYIKPCPIAAGEAHKIYRTDSSGYVTFNYADSIRKDIDNGTLFVNFRGHAGSHDWEVGMRDPNVLNNGNKLPLVVSLTCFTGENSKADFRGFGEKFVYLANKGAIGFVGTTGWSYSFDGNNFGTYLIQSFKTDTTRRMGDLMKAVGKSMMNDSLSFSVRHTINCYNLMGDPAVKLKLPKIPEFAIQNNDYSLSDQSIELNTPVTLTIFPKNFGMCADTCVVRFQLKRYNQNYSFRDTVYRNFKYEDTIKHNFSIDSIGVYKMVVTLDQTNRHPLEDKSNNTITIDIPVASTSFIPISPVNNTIVFKDSIELSCLNPNFTLNDKTVKVTLELDTTKLFNSPVKKTFINNNPSGGVTKFRSAPPVNINNTVYYWRSNSVINSDTSGWSKTQIFIHNNGQQSADNKEEDRLSSSFSPVILFKYNPDQFPPPDLVNTKFGNEGIKLIEYPANLFVRSFGSNAEESSYFSVGDKSIYIDAGKNTGLNMLKVRKLTGSIVEFKNLRMTTSPASSDSIISFLNTFDTTHYLMLLNASYVDGGRPLTALAKTKLRQFGSVYCDSVANLGYFHTWSFIGYLGANQSQVSESFDPCCRPIVPPCFACDHWTESVSNMNVIFKKPSGSVSNIVGPAQTWSDLSWNQSVFPFSNLVFDIIGIDISGQQTVLMSNIQSNKFVDLSSINANQYPRLNLLGKFTIDSLAGLNSPVLNGVTVNYTPASELVLDRNSLQLNPSPKDNSVSDFSFDYQNAGYSYIYGLIVNVTSGANLLLTDTINSILKTDSSKNYSNSFTLPQFRDSTNIVFHIKPKQSVNEFYTFNNFGEYTMKSSETISSAFDIEVLSDGRILNNGDYIRKTPEIKINVLKNISESLLSDTAQLSIRLNDLYIPYYVNGSLNRMLKALDNDNSRGENSISVNFYPELNTGENKLSVSYKDEFGNSDTMSVDVIVSDELLVKDFYNYPNPMRGETNFIFNLAGSAPPAGFKIKLYTVSGRLIRELDAPVNIGYNQIPWDGKDSDGDFVANGTYLYKLIAEDDSKIESQIQKLVVLR